MSVLTSQPEVSSEQVNYDLSVADAVWIAAAMAQRESVRDKADLMDPAALEMVISGLNLTNATKQSVLQHIRQHCVANKEPNPNRSCVLFETEKGRFRLYRDTDPRHPGREGAPSHPKWENLPKKFYDLREWYETVWNSPSALIANDPLLNAIGTGREIWKGIDPDAYVNELRDSWSDRG